MVEIIRDSTPDAKEITDFVEQNKKDTAPLRRRIENDVPFYLLNYFNMGKAKGDYQIVTSNKPRTFADKLIDELSNAEKKVRIPIYKDTKGDRDKCSMTEQLFYGLLNMIDHNLMNSTQPSSQGQIAWDVFVRGWVVLRYWMYQEGDDIVPDLAIWDVLDTFWLAGDRRLNRVCHTRYDTKYNVDKKYNQNFTADGEGNVLVYDHWDDQKETVVVDGAVVDSQKNWRKIIPVFIMPVGSMPMRRSDKYSKEMQAEVGPSCFARNREIWTIESQLDSYDLTNIGLAVHTPVVKEYDSSKGGEAVALEKNPYQVGATVDVDIGRGQKIYPMFPPPASLVIPRLSDKLEAMESMGALPRIMYGRQEQQTTAQGTAMLIHAGMGVLKSGINLMRNAYTWLANEAAKQYKDGSFEEIQVQGVDHRNKQFSTKIVKEDIVTDRRIEVEIKIATPQDELTNIGIADTAVKGRLLSLETIMDKYLSVPDVEAEKDKINREEGERVFPTHLLKMRDDLINDKDPDMRKYAWVIDAFIRQLLQSLMPQPTPAAPGGPPGAGQGGGVTGMPQPMQARATIPRPGVNAGGGQAGMNNQQRLNQMGLMYGGR